MRPNYKDWEEVPEDMIIQAAQVAERMGGPAGWDEVNFKKILAAGVMYKQAGLTPVYVWDEDSSRLAVYAQELSDYKYH